MNPPSAESTQKKRKLTSKQAGRLRAENAKAKRDEEKRNNDEFATLFLNMPTDVQASVIKNVPHEIFKAIHASDRHFRKVTDLIQREPFNAIDAILYKLIEKMGTLGDPDLEMYRLLRNLTAAQCNSGDQGFKNWMKNRIYPYSKYEGQYYTPPEDAPENIKLFFKSHGIRTHLQMKGLLLEAAHYVAEKKGIQTMFYPPKTNDPQLGQGRKTPKKRSTLKKRTTKKRRTLTKRTTLKKRRTLTKRNK